jgi:MSHA biogenesis protein MshO
MIMVIVITGILSGMVAVFIKGPVESYFTVANRADLTDVADTAVKRVTHDIRLALPNSLRNPVDGSDQCIEFMPTKSGGRYRTDQTTALTGDALDFTVIDPKFDMLGPNTNPLTPLLGPNSSLPTFSRIAVGDIVVVYNDGSASGDAYSGANAVAVAGLCETSLSCPTVLAGSTEITFEVAGATIFTGKQFPSASPANRFMVLPSTEQVVSFACSAGTLFRYSRNITARTTAWTQPANCAAMAAGTTATTLANNLSTCSLKYEPPGSGGGSGRFGIVSIFLGLTQSGETVSLYHQVHVDNAP